ncbi:TPA: hypothetical protein ACF5BZ_001351 [Vibrio parahaemolyticus]|uniref:hypothetical protein n=1 Tax=Vibrio parahaemolyticus TaxID=670 RepID=UPI00111CB50D|nr:hypothetical protein [Vibrio parahaemolyticus]EGR2713363.1 hypothetical protein [Vibrio parahaemolyticus]MDL2001214.1 hypothetical protein [Vibrio parahaemolyticus]TOM93160.1 hypothetical protein CGH68_01650 [Vibrio parahaemolyticus]
MTDIYVNKDQWEAIDDSEKKNIIDGLVGTGAMSASDVIKPDASIPPFDPEKTIELQWDPVRDLCLIACDAAMAAAFTWCAANTAGLGLVACRAAAYALRNKCREGC